MTLQLRRKHQITVASPKWLALPSNSPRTGLSLDEAASKRLARSLAKMFCALGVFTCCFAFQVELAKGQSTQSNDLRQQSTNDRPAKPQTTREIVPPVHAQPIRAVADGHKKSIRSRLFQRRQEAPNQSVPTTNSGQAQRQSSKSFAAVPTGFENAETVRPRSAQQRSAQQRSANPQPQARRFAQQPMDDSADQNPLRGRLNPNNHVQQVGYLQDDLNWRQGGSYRPANHQQSPEGTQLQGPMQDNWTPAAQNFAEQVQPINDPFGDQLQGSMSSSQPQQMIAPPRRRSNSQSPTPADPRTNPNYDQDTTQSFQSTAPEYSQSQMRDQSMPSFQAPVDTMPQSQSYSQQPIIRQRNSGEPRTVEPRRLYAPNRYRQQAAPARYRQDEAAQDDDEYGLDDDDLDEDLDGTEGLKSCDEYRGQLLNRPVTDIVVDISSYRPLEGYDDVGPEAGRQWRDRCGNHLGTGTLLRLERSYAIISNQQGQEQQLYLASLGDPDLEEIARYWGLPTECTLGCYQYYGRCWTPQTVTWYASNLCHKPLYFEDIQLERYGHSAGPFCQPARSTAHFFYSLVMFPYHKKINPPNECIYALGYYRPGNCAPWLVDPFPLSREGAVNMAIDYTTMSFIIP